MIFYPVYPIKPYNPGTPEKTPRKAGKVTSDQRKHPTGLCLDKQVFSGFTGFGRLSRVQVAHQTHAKLHVGFANIELCIPLLRRTSVCMMAWL